MKQLFKILLSFMESYLISRAFGGNFIDSMEFGLKYIEIPTLWEEN